MPHVSGGGAGCWVLVRGDLFADFVTAERDGDGDGAA